MFTGIIQKMGTITELSRSGEGSGRITLQTSAWPRALEHGESIAVSGVCLSLADFATLDSGEIRIGFDVLDETFDKTGLPERHLGDRLNLERALCFGDALGGHIVSGHIDEPGTVVAIEAAGRDWKVRFRCSKDFLPYLVYKGSVCIDGISLTVASLEEDGFWVHLIPITWEHTSLGTTPIDGTVNLEADLISKYVQRQLAENEAFSALSWDDIADLLA